MTDVSAHRAFALLKEYGFERLSCSENEKKAAEAFLGIMKEAGAEACIEEFTVPCGDAGRAKLVVTEPYVKEYDVIGFERSLSTPAGGLDAEFYYAENLLPANLCHVKDKIVLINGRLRRDGYEKLKKAGVLAILTFSGSVTDRRSETDLDIYKLREPLTEPFGDCVAANIRVEDAAEIVRRGAAKMHLEVAGNQYDGTSRNVCAVIRGTEFPDEIISFGAHYDSVHFSTGVYDNLSGSAILLELVRYFAANKPKRTMRFNLYGSEEQGLLGSKAWTKAHEDELEKHVLMINIDVAAATLGYNNIPVIAEDAAVSYVDALMMEAGFACSVRSSIYSSDCIPFADHGIPAINVTRFGVHGADFIHERRDNLKTGYLDEHALDQTLRQALLLAKRLDGAKVFPIKRSIPDQLKEKVDEYLFKKPKKED